MKSKKLLFVSAVVICMIFVFMISAFATTSEATASLKIVSNTLELQNAVFMNFKVDSENISDKSSIKLLVWEEAPSEYDRTTADATLLPIRTESDTGYLVFQYDNLSAKEMTRFIYVCAYADVNGEEVYSKPVKFSVLQYAYNVINSESSSEGLRKLVTDMLQYGATAQSFFGYKTDFLATDEVAKVKVVNGTHADGFKTGYYKAGTSVTLTANAAEEGYVFSHWEDSNGSVVGSESTLIISECASETYTAVYRDATSDVQYRYRDKQYSTSATELNEPWILYNTTTTYTHGSYNYLYLRRTLGGNDYGYSYDDIILYRNENSKNYCFHGTPTEMYQYVRKYVSAGPEYLYLTYSQSFEVDLTKYSFYQNCWALKYCTQKTEQKTYHYYQWSEWSDWSDTPITVTDDREVEVRGVFTVTYDANGGENAPEMQTKAGGESIIISATIPTRTGYSFEGWSSTGNGNVEYNPGDTYSNDSNITLYAVWEANTYTITYNANGGENAPDVQIKTHGIDLTLSTVVPTREGYTFKGWATTVDGTVAYNGGDTYFTNDGITLYAVWEENLTSSDNIPEGLELTLNSVGTAYSVTGYTGMDTEIIIPSVYNGKFVTSIADRAFSGCAQLKKVTVPNSVISIGVGSFYGCTGLNYIILPESLTHIGNSSFYGCTSLLEIDIPNNVISIEDHTFHKCKNLRNVDLPNNLTTIGKYAFYYCKSIKSIILPNNVISIGYGAFMDCSSLNYSTYDNGKYLGTSTNLYYALINTESDRISSLSIHNQTIIIADNAMDNCDIVTMAIPDSVIRIGNGAFNGCESLSYITLSNTVKYIGSYAFSNCIKLQSVDIPSGVVCLTEGMFSGCESLEKIIIPNTVTSIETYALAYCTSLKNINIPSSVENIDEYAFLSSDNLSEAIFGSSTGWKVNNININNLSDTSVAAKYLIDTYYNYRWTKD